MPQLFQVLRCFKCLVFQIHQLKKSNKWQCKMCGEKQSIKRHYGLGNGKECRLHVQRLNAMRGHSDEEKPNAGDDLENFNYSKKISDLIQVQTESKSKWTTYVEKEEEIPYNVNNSTYLQNKEVCLEIPKHRKKNRDPKKRNKEIRETFAEKNNIESLNKNQCIEVLKDPPAADEIIKQCKISQTILKPNNKVPNVKQNDLVSNKSKTDVVVQKTSKWAQFVEAQNELVLVCESNEAPGAINSSFSCNAQKLFTLCDDNDLDMVLEI